MLLTTSGQVSIKSSIRKALKLKPGDMVDIDVIGKVGSINGDDSREETKK